MNPCCIFDLDGTLVDSLQGIANSLNRALTLHELPIHTPTAVRGFIGDGSRMLIRRSLPNGAREELLDNVEQAFKTDYDQRWQEGTIIYPGIAELLENLQSQEFPLAVLSNKPHEFTVAIVTQLFPEIHFGTVLGQRTGIPHKPDPTGALEIARSLKLQAKECVMIGDSTMDLETAQAAGMHTIAVTWGFHDRPRLIAAGAGQLADDAADLLKLLAKFRN